MSRKILMTNISFSDDFGGPSIGQAFCDMCRRNDDTVEIGWLTSVYGPKDREFIKKNNIKVIEFGYVFSLKKVFPLLKTIGNENKSGNHGNSELERVIRGISRYNVVVDMGGLCFSDDMEVRGLMNILLQKRIWIVSKLLGKKVVLYTTALGPVRKRLTASVMKLYINKFCDYVFLRDDVSNKIYKKYRLKTGCRVCPDTAFMFDVKRDSSDSGESGHNRIGVSLSFQMMKQIPHYFSVMQSVLEELLREGCTLCLIANECNGYAGADDEFVCREMVNRLGADIEIVSTTDMDSMHMKMIISDCSVVIASRYHTMLAAISSCTPTLALSWHPKYIEAMSLLSQEKYVVEKNNFNSAYIIKMFGEVFDNREKIREVMNNRISGVRKEVLEANDLFMKICGEG